MNILAKTIVALSLAAVAIPASGFAQTPGTQAAGFEHTAIADLTGRTMLLANWTSYGLDPLPAGQSYGVKDSRIVVDDANGAVLHIVRVIGDMTGSNSGLTF